MPTASAVVADVIDCARHMNGKKFFGWQDSEDGYVANYLDTQSSFYIRMTADDAAAALVQVNKAFGEVSMLARADAPDGEFAFVTAILSEKELADKLATFTSATAESIIRITDY